jgi:hypothetical protein
MRRIHVSGVPVLNDPPASRSTALAARSPLTCAAPSSVISLRCRSRPCSQGLTLVHFSAQTEPSLTQNTPYTLLTAA